MRYRDYLKHARIVSRGYAGLNTKQHLVVCLAFDGRTLLDAHINTDLYHSEHRALKQCPDADRLVVYRFNRADASRLDRPSCPCFRCCPLIQRSNVRKVEFMSPLGPVVVKVSALEPYNGKDQISVSLQS